MLISYFCFNNKNKDFEILAEHISKEKIESSYDIKEIEFRDFTLFPKAIYNLQNIGVFCFCEKFGKSEDLGCKYSLEFSVSFKPRESQNSFSEYYEAPVYLDIQSIFSSLVSAGVCLNNFSIYDKKICKFSLEASSIDKIYSDFLFSKMFIKKIFVSQFNSFLFGVPGKKDVNLEISFEEDSEKLKEFILENFKDLSLSEPNIKHSFSSEENFLNSLFTVVNSYSA